MFKSIDMISSRTDVGMFPNYLGGLSGRCLIGRSASGWLGLADNVGLFVPDTTAYVQYTVQEKDTDRACRVRQGPGGIQYTRNVYWQS